MIIAETPLPTADRGLFPKQQKQRSFSLQVSEYLVINTPHLKQERFFCKELTCTAKCHPFIVHIHCLLDREESLFLFKNKNLFKNAAIETRA